MTNFDETERQFRALHDSAVKEYEEQLQRAKAARDERNKRKQADEAELRKSLKGSGIDFGLLDKRDQRDADALDAHLKRVRPGLVSRASGAAADFKQRSLQASLLSEVCQIKVPLYTASIIAPDTRYLDGIEGERSGAWIFPSNPGQVELFDNDKGSGTGWGAEAGSAMPPTATFWFSFTPSQTARWELTAILAFHGFYIARADDGIFTHKEAKVRLHVKLDIFQYFWNGAKLFKLIDIDESDIDVVEFYDRTEFLFDTVTLRAGDPVWVKVDVSVRALADGGGSYAEINFRDGAANFIEPLFLSIVTV